ncbi:IclR family transcriptional regulator [Luteimicrobium sp. DT211]|uniref:IclR family transcriptional regulator n=1 Tax=Luteimicrobium sp. DT211 TaxID=3393412 RepID=UPI003CF2808F
MTDRPSRAPAASQTLSRGLQLLEALADAREPLTIDELAARIGVHRSIAYRLLRTLEDHGLVVRSDGRVTIGPRMATLAAGVSHDLQAQALPELTAVANDLGMTCFLVVLDADECITLVSVEPRHALATVVQRPGARHPVTAGAPGRAVLSLLPDDAWPEGASTDVRARVAEVRDRGYATSHDEVIPGVSSVAVPLVARGQRPAALAVVHVADPRDPAALAARLQRSAATIRESLGG